MQKLNVILLFGIASAVGALLRHTILYFLMLYTENTLEWGIFIINITGCFLFGLLYSIGKIRKILLAGFVGSYTTFSTYIFDIYTFIQCEAWSMLFLNAFMQIVLGYIALYLGMSVHKVHNRLA